MNESETKKIIERFAEIQGITYEEAAEKIDAPTDEDILQNIEKFTTDKINQASGIKLNRAQRRALAKKSHNPDFKAPETANTVADIATKLDYIDLIEKLRALNKKNKENEKNGDEIEETNL